MPELPEVEIFKRFIDRHALNQAIQAVTVRHPKGLRDCSPELLTKISREHAFTQTLRHGKYLLVKLEPVAATGPLTPLSAPDQTVPSKRNKAILPPRDDQPRWLVFHFGMTGCLSYTSSRGVTLNAYEDGINRDAHIRVSFQFDDGGQLHFHDQRLFGYISCIDEPHSYFQAKKLGPDALTILEQDFLTQLQHKTGALKPILMNQAVVAGLGNIYVDELLFQLRLHPAQPVKDLSQPMLKRMRQEMQDILNRSIALQTDRDALPAHYLWHQRHPKGQCPRDGLPFRIETIGGRTTYFCPQCQVLKAIR